MGNVFGQADDQTTTNVGTSFDMQTVIAGFQQGLIGLTSGAKVDLLIPSNLGYSLTPQTTTDPTTGGTVVVVPTLSCLRYSITVVSVTN
jgi:FKBP-type peptidyl-prolyl cis-trans isomerase